MPLHELPLQTALALGFALFAVGVVAGIFLTVAVAIDLDEDCDY